MTSCGWLAAVMASPLYAVKRICWRVRGRSPLHTRAAVATSRLPVGVTVFSYVKAPMPVMARRTMSVCMVSVPSKVWIASMSTMCRMTW